MLELYFVLYRIPKMMSSLARERNRSALKWSLLGIAAWIGGQIFVGLALGIIYGIGIVSFGWPEQESAGVSVFCYVASLAAAIGAFTLARRILREKSANPLDSADPLLQPPPPPPQF